EGRIEMGDSNVVHLFQQLDEAVQALVKKQDELYLESLADVLQYIYLGEEKMFEVEIKDIRNELDSLRRNFLHSSYPKKVLHRTIQLALLKGMKNETQPNHRMTPESIALFISYLIQKLIGDKERITLFNPASGTGNLLH